MDTLKNNPYQPSSDALSSTKQQKRENLSRLSAYFASMLFLVTVALVAYAMSYLWRPLPILDELVRFWLTIATGSWILGTCLVIISFAFQRSKTSLWAFAAGMFAFYWPMAGWGIAWQL